jgi:predicted TIM-barrel fold metal-dependent hydrolase
MTREEFKKTFYGSLTKFERALARFGDQIGIIAGLEITKKISPEEAYQQVKKYYKKLKSLRKKERDMWGEDLL